MEILGLLSVHFDGSILSFQRSKTIHSKRSDGKL